MLSVFCFACIELKNLDVQLQSQWHCLQDDLVPLLILRPHTFIVPVQVWHCEGQPVLELFAIDDDTSLQSRSVWSWLGPDDRHVWWERICWKRASVEVVTPVSDWGTCSLHRIRFLVASTTPSIRIPGRNIRIHVSRSGVSVTEIFWSRRRKRLGFHQAHRYTGGW